MHKSSRALIVAVLLGALAVAAGPMSMAGARADQTPTPNPSPFVVHLKNYAFVPATLTVPVGALVEFQNDDSVAHTVTATGKEAFDSGNLDGGAKFKHTFSKAGRFDYVCAYHPNMKGTIVVSDVAASPTPFVPPSPTSGGY